MSERFKTLFDHNARLNPDGQMLSNQMSRAIDEIFRRFLVAGFSPREISHVGQMCVFEMELEGVLNLTHLEVSPDGKSLVEPAPRKAAGKTPAP